MQNGTSCEAIPGCVWGVRALQVIVEFTLAGGVNYTAVSANATFFAEFEQRVKEVIADSAGDDTTSEQQHVIMLSLCS